MEIHSTQPRGGLGFGPQSMRLQRVGHSSATKQQKLFRHLIILLSLRILVPRQEKTSLVSKGRQSWSPSAAQELDWTSAAGLGRLLTRVLTTCRATRSRGWLEHLSELPSSLPFGVNGGRAYSGGRSRGIKLSGGWFVWGCPGLAA